MTDSAVRPRGRYLAYLWQAARMAIQAHREGRLTASPSRWLVDLRHLYGVMRAEGPTVPSPTTRARDTLDLCRERVTAQSRAALATFLRSGARLVLPHFDCPAVSVVIVVFNRAELTLRCLESIAATADVSIEVILVDNASTDATPALLARVDGASVIRLDRNEGFLKGSNIGARNAHGVNLLLLNSDAELLPGSLAAAVDALVGADRVGAVGARLVLPDGALQEAGSIIWSDGSCLGYGRGDDPYAPAYSFTRSVDFCSAAFLLTPRALFERLGGFDVAYAPAYYEDADYCARLWQAGYRVVYEPRVIVRHFEFASAPSNDEALRRQEDRRALFVSKHGTWLLRQHAPSSSTPLAARVHDPSPRRVLVFDDRIPRTPLGSGFPRAVELLRALVTLGWQVTFYPLWMVDEPRHGFDDELPRSVEVVTRQGTPGVRAFLDERRGHYDCVIVSRSHNLHRLRAVLGPVDGWCPGTPIVYDAEAVQAVRETMRGRLVGELLDDAAIGRAVEEELRDIGGVAAVMTVSASEGLQLAKAGRPVHVVGHAVRPSPDCRPFEERNGLLFVGAFDSQSPNADSVCWFCEHVWPRLRLRIGPATLTIAGHAPPAEVLALDGDGIRVVPDPHDLSPLYGAARVVIAPTRFAAGIPLKVIHAAAAGVPVACTRLLAGQLGWDDGTELFCGDTPEQFIDACVSAYLDRDAWYRVRQAALERVEADHAPPVFLAAVDRCLQGALAAGWRAAVDSKGAPS